VIVVGCGFHFASIYLKVLEEYAGRLELVLAVDLKCEEHRVRQTFTMAAVSPQAYLFLPDKLRVHPKLDELRVAFATKPEAAEADAILICTEPKAHKAFALWAVERGLAVFMDKPISAFDEYQNVNSIDTDFADILAASLQHAARVVISCERRLHYGYRYVDAFLRDFIRRYRVPITYVNVHFGGGVWVMPWEFEHLENHPLKYGYGVLLHSGYHYVDLVARFAELNCAVRDVALDKPRVNVNASFPSDLFDSVGDEIYERLFSNRSIHETVRNVDRARLKGYGEVDFSAIGSYRAAGRKCLDFSLQLIGTTVAARENPERLTGRQPTNGRMRQEEVIIHLGNFCSLSVHSSPFTNVDPRGSIDDFNITIAMNPRVTQGPRVLRIDRAGLSRIYRELPGNAVLNVLARKGLLRGFLDGDASASELSSHRHSVTLLAELLRELRRSHAAA
jgi:predicted dehydrogenase